MSTLPRHELISFGVFEVDVQAGELRRSGMRIRLQSQPFHILTALLSRPGEILTREELQIEIWGADTTVDFDRGIASAMNKIREALGDSAERPLYIETVAKRGYRFIAPVAVGFAGDLDAPPVSVSPVPVPSVDPSSVIAPGSLAAEPAHSPVIPGNRSDRQYGALRARTVACLCLFAVALVGTSSLATYLAVSGGRPVRPPRVTQLTLSNQIYDGPPNPENLLSLVTDGPRIYTSFLSRGRAQIASIDLSGKQLQPVNMPDELSSVSITDISRDGSKLIVRGQHSRDSEQPLWIVPTTGSSALRVGDVVAHDATFMPGGGSILYASGNELNVAQLDTGAISNYASLPGRAFWMRWSPAGDQLRFTLIDPITHRLSLWQLDAATRHVHPLQLPGLPGLSECCGSWTADGSLYVFQASNAWESNIWSVETGAHPRITELTNGPLHYVSPLPSSAEHEVFFVGLETPSQTRFYDQKTHQFVPAPAFLERARRVTYSRDGKWVAWADLYGRLWRARSSDGSGLLQLTPDDLDVFLAQWSPDGSQLVLMARTPGETWQLYTIAAAGGVVRSVLAGKRNIADPDWSADGSHLVFGREADLMGKESGSHDIQILDLKDRSTQVLPESENLFSPRWSPDGRWIVALSLDQTRLVLYDVQSRTWATLFTGSAADPVWSLDSRMVYFHAFAAPDSAILRVPVTGGPAQPVADLSQVGLPAVDNYFFGGVTPTGAPIIEPRIGTGNLFSVHLSQ